MTAPRVGSVAQQLYDAIPPAWTEQDSANGYVLLALCDAVTRSGMQPLADYALDKPDGTPGWSALFDARRMTARTARYLGQFVGVTVPPGLTDTQAQQLIASHPGYGRGRPDVIVNAVRSTLTGSQRVTLKERDTSAYHATILVFASQMPDLAKTQAAIARTKPAADVISLTVKQGLTYGDIRSSLGGGTGDPTNYPSTSNYPSTAYFPASSGGTYGQRKALYPTYGTIQGSLT